MDSPTLPTPLSNDNLNDHLAASSAAETRTEHPAQSLPPNSVILAEALTDSSIHWQIHNCKVSKKTVTQELPLPFLYHYDSLDDAVKQANPLTPALLAQFNRPMSASEAAQLIGIEAALISSPWHIKVIGSLVVFSEALQLAVRLHWTNTGKDTEQIYTKEAMDALSTALKDWQFFGRVDVLYKNDKQTLASVLEDADSQTAANERILPIAASAEYQLLPAPHALEIIARLEADKTDLPWFDKAILERLA